MIKGFVLAFVFLLLMVVPLSVALTSTSSVVSDDSWIDSSNVDSTHGTSSLLGVRNDGDNDVRKSFVRFDLDSVLNDSTTINSAIFRLFMYSQPNNAGEHVVKRISEDWNETGLNWANQPSTFGISDLADVTNLTNGLWIEWDVSFDVRGFINGSYDNHGWMVEDEVDKFGEVITKYRSSKNDTNGPQLVVDYSINDNNDTNISIDLVNVGDLLDLLAKWGPCENNGSFCDHDFNEDGKISKIDLEVLLAFWGQELNVSFGDPDVNGDGHIDVTDLLQVLAAFGACPTGGDASCPEDILIDGVVDKIDIKILLASWGQGITDGHIPDPENVVDVTNLLELLAFWGPCEEGNCTQYDFNDNEEIQESDLKILLALWGLDWDLIDSLMLANSPDINGDGVVNVSDLLALLAAWNECSSEEDVDCPADIFGDEVVDEIDLGILRAFWGTVFEEEVPDDDSGGSSGGGGGGGSSSSSGSNVVFLSDILGCTTTWECGDWNAECVDGFQTRECNKLAGEEECFAGQIPQTRRACENLSEGAVEGLFSFITGAFVGADGKPSTKGVLAFIIALVIVYFIVGSLKQGMSSASAAEAVTGEKSKEPS